MQQPAAENLQRKSIKHDENFATIATKKAGNHSKLIIYFLTHLRVALTSLNRLRQNPLATTATLIVIAIALALPAALFVLLQNAKYVSQGLNTGSQISLYLKMDVTPDQTQTLINQLKSQSDIAAVKYVSPAQGLQELQQQMDFQNVISELNTNPLPGVILVQPAASLQTPEALDTLLQKLKLNSNVGTAQLDMQWIKRLHAIVDLCRHIVYALGCLLAIGVLFIIGNTINLTLQKYRREIEVFKLVGATNAFVRRPFLYTGMLLGLFGGIIAWLLVSVLLWWLKAPVHHLVSLYGSNFQLQALNLHSGLMLILLGILLGLAGAWLAVGKHLRTI